MLRRLSSEVRVKLVLILGMQLILALMANRIFGRLVWPYLLGTLVVTGVTVLAQPLRPVIRWGALGLTIAASTALCSWWADGPLINLRIADGAPQLLSTEWPSPASPEAIALIGLVLAVIDALSATATLRSDLHLLPLVPIGLGAVGATALSAPDGPFWPAWIGGSVLAVIFAIVHHGTTIRTRTSAIASERSVVASVAVLALAGVIGVMLTPNETRSDPRQLEDPTTSAALLDPVEATIAMRASSPPVDLYSLENRSSLSPALPSFWRLTALNRYDGQRWQPESALRPIGQRLNRLPEGQGLTRAPTEYAITPLTERLDLLPFPGQPLTVSTDVNTDVERVVVQLRQRPFANRTVEATALNQPNRGDIGNQRVATRPVDEFSASFTDFATELAGDGNDMTKLSAIETTMRETWQLAPESPGAGQQFALLERFVRETRRGTREQFVAGFVLLAQSLGYDSRVASGFVVPPQQDGTSMVLNTSQAAVWPEVRVENVGWIRFDPVPATVADDAETEQPTQQVQSPAVPQPPIVPPQEQVDRDDDPPPPEADGSARFAALRRLIMTVLTYSAIVLAPLALIFGGVLGFKAVRRWRRLRTDDPAARIRAAWANSTDIFVDAGLSIPKSFTNLDIASTAHPLAPTAPQQVRRLAELSTLVTFGNPDVDEIAADDAVTMSRTVNDAVGSNMSRWQRLRWRLSLRSIRRSTRSPVVP